MRFSERTLRAVALVTALAVAATIGWLVLRPDPSIQVTAYFTRTVGVYAGSDVRVLGVKVGEITDVIPQGTQVKVVMDVDRSVKIPADAAAVVVPPSLVSDRYVQLTPVYQAGPQLAAGAVIPLERTATPLELDEIYSTLDELSVALGPNGANADGALNDLVDTAAANLEGNGESLNSTFTSLSGAVQTLSNSSGDLFATVSNLQTFTSALAVHDAEVRTFNTTLADVSVQLAGERQDLALALQKLSVALSDVAAFVAENKTALSTNISKLVDITKVFVDQRDALSEALDTAPVAVGNLANAYNDTAGTLDTRDNRMDPATTVCSLLNNILTASPQLQASLQLGERCTELFGQYDIPTLADLLDTLGGGGGGVPSLPGIPPGLLPVPGGG